MSLFNESRKKNQILLEIFSCKCIKI